MCGVTAADPVMGWRPFFYRSNRRKQLKMDVKLYVGNLAKSTTEEELKNLFTQAGPVALVEVIKDRDSGQSKGFAFVTMNDQGQADAAITKFNGFSLADHELKVNVAKPKVDRGGATR